ncbi:LysR family transcriptional regulator [Roseibium alexandrii]|uniref:HTH-type transcriptional regulator LeuO n=1 Tax=Roseibium alexandrii TaxID=388408 RepID=A0A0M6ZZE1_9HYPH|nr:LysR family transcriptional regulator [Roseibium alexandrii]CTQ67542.1 HTH-type transcriptional regulator LeuO [Roseibium alexandrii]
MKDTFSEIELRKLDLNLLLVFSAVMRERSVSRAADRLYLGASAISMALGRLRDTFEDPLFVRVGSVMEPTARAIAFWQELAPALQNIDQAVRVSKPFDPSTTERIFRFGAPDDLEGLLVPRLIGRLQAEAPQARLVVRHSDFRSLLRVLDDDEADIMLSATPESGIENRHRVDPIYRERFKVLYDAGQLGFSGPLTRERYLATPHALLSLDGALESGLDQKLAESGHKRDVRVAVTHFPTIPHILKSSAMLANVPGTAAAWFARQHALEIHEPPIDFPSFEVALLSHVRVTNDPAVDWFRDLIMEEVRSLALATKD